MVLLLAVLLGLPALPVPFIPQQKDGCGAAALAMVLRYLDLPGDHREIAARLQEPSLHGIRGSRLATFAQEQGLVAIPYAGDMQNIRAYLAKGRPLIVAWGLGRGRFHNVVVLGLDDANGDVIVHDPARGAHRRVPRQTFEKRWKEAGHWTLVVARKAP